MMTNINYDEVPLSDHVNSIIERDFYVLNNLTAPMIRAFMSPVKFSASSSIYLRRGSCKAYIHLMERELKAPCFVNIAEGQILHPTSYSEDFEACFLVLSKSVVDKIYMLVNRPELYSVVKKNPVVDIPPALAKDFDQFYADMAAGIMDTNVPDNHHALLYTLLAFFYRVGDKCYRAAHGQGSSAGRISESFLRLVSKYFKQERFLDFYASQLQLTPKHLSRVVKEQTGHSAVEWIERHLILEAKVLLRSTNLNVQQIADELNFNSQGAFGKYFKKAVGVSPREFRNSLVATK